MIAEKSNNVERAVWTAISQSEELVALLEQAQLGASENHASALGQEIKQRRTEQDLLKKITERDKTPPSQ